MDQSIPTPATCCVVGVSPSDEAGGTAADDRRLHVRHADGALGLGNGKMFSQEILILHTFTIYLSNLSVCLSVYLSIYIIFDVNHKQIDQVS